MAKNKEKFDPYKELGKADADADAAPADPAPQPAQDVAEFKGGESAWGYDPAARAEQAADSAGLIEEPVAPSTAEAEALTTGKEVAQQYRPDADPLYVECLELLQRLHAGGLILPTAYSAFEETRALIAKLKEKTAPEREEKEK